MPIVKSFANQNEASHESADEVLFDERGKLTLEGKVIRDFLKEVDMNPLFDVPEIQEGIDRFKTTGTVIADTVWEVKKDDDEDDEEEEDDDEEPEDDDEEDDEEEEKGKGKGKPFGGKQAPPFGKKKDEAVEVEVEIMPGELAASIIDEDDLYGMFVEYILGMPTETLEERLQVQSIIRYIDENEVLTEAPFAKGDFRKIRKGAKKTKNGLSGPEVVKSMLVAMMHKHAIKRAKAPAGYTARGAGSPGKGYRGGDYEKDPAGYGAGTSAGNKAVMKFRKGHKAEIEKKSKKKKGYLKAKLAREKKGAGKPKMVAAPKATTKRVKAKEIAKKTPTPRAQRGNAVPVAKHKIVASADGPNNNLHENYVPPLYEGAGMAAKVLGGMKTVVLTEGK